MTQDQLFEALRHRALPQTEITSALEKLISEDEVLVEFMLNNSELISGISAYKLADQLMLVSQKLVKKRVAPTLIKNVYDPYSMIFMILSMQYVEKSSRFNKLMSIFGDVVANSSKFDLYTKKNRNLRLVTRKEDLMEFFWLIPLFLNIDVLITNDLKRFIENNEDIQNQNAEYAEGYVYFIKNITHVSKEEFREYVYSVVK